MSRIVLLILLFVASADRAAPNQVEYPPLARDTLVGAWQGLIGIGTHPVVFHAVIAPRDSDSYLSEIFPDTMQGRLFRLESCTVTNGKITLHFTMLDSDCGWWIEGEGFGDKNFAWIKGRISIPDRPKPGPASFYFERITWLRDVGWAALRAAEKIPKK